MASSSSGREGKVAVMEPATVPDALRRRLGDEASFELVTMIQAAGLTWREGLLTEERFERFELAANARFERLEQRFEHLESVLSERFERRLAEQGSVLRQEIANTRFELLKWSFLFWVGQVVTVGGMMAFALRSIPR
jgi:hypothetical protein